MNDTPPCKQVYLRRIKAMVGRVYTLIDQRHQLNLPKFATPINIQQPFIRSPKRLISRMKSNSTK